MTDTVTGVRLREATADDVPFLAWVMLAASRSHLTVGIWEYLFRLDEEQALEFLARVAVTGEPHVFHHSLFRIAEVDGEPAAGMCTYDPDTQGFGVALPAIGAALTAMGLDPFDQETSRRNGVFMGGMVPDHHGPEGRRIVVENVATKADHRGKGFCDALLRDVLHRARTDGYRSAQIGVFIGNEPARRAYLKAGFEFAADARSADWDAEIGCPGTELLVQEI